MDIEASLEKEHSKTLTLNIVKYVGNDPVRFKILMNIFLKGEYRLTQRAAWPLSYIAIDNPKLITPYFPQLIKKLQTPDNHPAIDRNILRAFQEMEIPEKYCGVLIDICLKFITSELKATAIRAFAITVAANICKRFPELKAELMMIFGDLQQHPQLPAIRSRIKSAIKALQSV